jgi:PncC family amidohydrolase
MGIATPVPGMGRAAKGTTMIDKDMLALAERIAARLIERRETVAVAESSTGGLIAAALLAVPGASAYFLGGAVVYTLDARRALLDIGADEMAGMRPATEAYSALIANRVLERHRAVWGLGETGAAGPTGNRYGDPAGHTCIAVAGPAVRAITFRTGQADRGANMSAFARRALELLAEATGAGQA